MGGFANILQALMQRQGQQQPQPGAPGQAGGPFAQMLAQLMGQQQQAQRRTPPPYVAPWAAAAQANGMPALPSGVTLPGAAPQTQKPGPAPDPATLMGRVGGLGNGGGKMGIQTSRFVKGY